MLVPFKRKGTKKTQYNVADWTAGQLDKIKTLITEKDRDYLVVVCGDEGSGKSMFAGQLAFYIDRNFTYEQMCLTPDEFAKKIVSLPKGSAVVFDEAITGLSTAGSMTVINRMMREYLMEMRKRNLFVILCIPSFFYLDKYVALHRARALFRTYFSKGKPGQYLVYNRKKMKTLYLVGKQKMSYNYPKATQMKRFPNISPIDWKLYEDKKLIALKAKKEISPRAKKQIAQRDALLYFLNKVKGEPQHKIEAYYKERGIEIPQKTISDAIKREEERVQAYTGSQIQG